MQKRIKNNIMIVTIASVLFVTVFLSLIFYNLLTKQVQLELWDRAQMIRQILNTQQNDHDMLTSFTLNSSNVRYTFISPDGDVVYDSQAEASLMPNHKGRTEVQQAMDVGKGESKRFSNTIGLESHYVAYRLDHGGIIRLSQSSSSIFGIFSSILPGSALVIIFILILVGAISKRITLKIIEPINQVDLMDENINLYDELSVFARTISQYKKQIEVHISDIESKSDMINAIIGSIKEGIVLLSGQGVIITANQSALDLFQVNRNVLGKNILEITRNTEILENTHKALSGKNCEMLYVKDRRSYQVFFSPGRMGEQFAEQTTSPGRVGQQLSGHLNEPETQGGVIILFLDITEKIGAEKIRREFSANVTHELKTPLTNISGYAEMMSSGMARTEDFVMFSARIKDEASRLILLIDDILLLSQLDEGDMSLEMRKIDLISIAKQVLEALSEKANASRVSLHLYGENVVAEVNPSMIYELIYNLIDNGIKYNKTEGKVEIFFESQNDVVQMYVKDTGIGIPYAHQDRIFERFYRVDKSRSKKTGGTGLGLSIVKHIVQVHKGAVTIDSREGIGTTVLVKI